DRRSRLVTRSTASITGLFFDYRHSLANDIKFRAFISAKVRRSILTETLSYAYPTKRILPRSVARYYGLPDARFAKPGDVNLSRLPSLDVAVARYRLGEGDQAWIRVLGDVLGLAGLRICLYESNC